MLRIDGSYINITLRLFRLVYWEGKMHSSSVATNRYTRVPNITGVPNKIVGWNFFMKIKKTGGDSINKKFRIRTYLKEGKTTEKYFLLFYSEL